MPDWLGVPYPRPAQKEKTMTNPLKGEVTFEARGETFTFKLGTNAQIMLENKVGTSLLKFFENRKSDQSLTISDMRMLFHAGLFREHKMTEEEVGDLMDEIGIERVGQIFKEANEMALPKTKTNGADDDARPPKPTKERIGMNS